MRHIDPSETEAVDALSHAMLTRTTEAWQAAGITCANHTIGHHPEEVLAELTEVDQEWNAGTRLGPNWLALITGYRDTLREYVERGTD